MIFHNVTIILIVPFQKAVFLSTFKVTMFMAMSNRGDGLMESSKATNYAVLSKDEQKELPNQFTVCSIMYYGQHYFYQGATRERPFFSIMNNDKHNIWMEIKDSTVNLESNSFDEDLGFKTGTRINSRFIGNILKLYPLKMNSWQHLCAAIDAESGKISVVRYVKYM